MNKRDKVSVFYGRARRIELAEKIAYIVVGIVAVVLVIFLVFKQTSNTNKNIDFSYLRDYFLQRGYSCEMIHQSGGQCTLTKENIMYKFIRYDNGFEYFEKTDSYLLNIKHVLDEENKIVFKTTSEAFVGFKNEEYTCEYKVNVINELGTCRNNKNETLNQNSYLGVIEKAMNELNNIIDSSGYYKVNILEDYQWIKK